MNMEINQNSRINERYLPYEDKSNIECIWNLEKNQYLGNKKKRRKFEYGIKMSNSNIKFKIYR